MSKRASLVVAAVCLASVLVVVATLSPRSDQQEVVTIADSRIDLPFEDIVRGAELIVLGSVTKLGQPVWSKPLNAEGLRVITTPVFLQVEEVVKGDVTAGVVVQFRQIGGTIGKTTVVCADDCTFSPGERVIVGLYRPGGMTTAMADGELVPADGKYVLDSEGKATHCWRHVTRSTSELLTAMESALATYK